jgi:hypothetical protein
MKMHFNAARYAATAILATVFAGTAWAHATLQSATPAKDAAVAAPKEVRLKFNEKLEAAFSSAKVLDSSGKVIETGKATLDDADPSVMKVNVPSLSAGKYTVQYVVVGHDGHRRKGEYSFSVK